MNTIRLVKGEIFFDDFNSAELDPRWTLLPNLPERISLVERPGYLKIFHGVPDIMVLMDESDNYILDVKNDYIPLTSLVQSGIIVFRELDQSLEVLEYYDAERSEYYVYEYIRLIKSGNLYTVYGRNTQQDSWELVASLEFQSAGKVGLICKGPSVAGSSHYNVDFVKMYKSNELQLLNVPVGYRVDICREYTNEVIFSRRVTSPYNGASLVLDEIPNVRAYFKIFDESYNEVHTSAIFDMCGGDVYYYGSTLNVYVNEQSMRLDTEYFLGYYQSNKIDFTIRLQNPHEVPFNNVTIEAIPYEDDQIGYSLVKFSSVENDLSENYTATLTISQIEGSGSTTIYGRVFRSSEVEPSDVDPFKFNLKITNS